MQELSTWYTDISDALTGTWEKIAAFFIGTAVIIFKQGGIIGRYFMVLLGLSIGSIPTIINSKYTLIAGEMASNSLLTTMASFVGEILNKSCFVNEVKIDFIPQDKNGKKIYT